MTYLTHAIKLPLGIESKDYLKIVSEFVGIDGENIHKLTLRKRSIDARDKSQIRIVCSFVFDCDYEPKHNCDYYTPKSNILNEVEKTKTPQKIIVIGSGPAGLFSALYLSKAGHNVIIIERGEDVTERKATVDKFFVYGQFNDKSNVQFGLGGAGTFSDGKLTSGISSPYINTVFEEFNALGAPDDIMYSNTPHIGTDYLTSVVDNMRREIENYGGQFLFNTTVIDLDIIDGSISGVICDDGSKTYRISASKVVLAIGHSARNTLKVLQSHNVLMAQKAFAMGVRVEHSQKIINFSQYGLSYTHRDLESANYKMAVTLPSGRSAYTFCMCPGGVVLPANSTNNSIVTNGMSLYARNADNSNSALLVNCMPSDFGSDDVLAGVELQAYWESRCFNAVNRFNEYKAPCQNVVDFIRHKKTAIFDTTPSYARGVVSICLDEVLPTFIVDTLRSALPLFGNKIDGFDKCGVLTAIESRSSSPVKIVRDELSLESNIKGLYPCGEGAGYSGGIVSSAVDGLKVAIAISDKIK